MLSCGLSGCLVLRPARCALRLSVKLVSCSYSLFKIRYQCCRKNAGANFKCFGWHSKERVYCACGMPTDFFFLVHAYTKELLCARQLLVETAKRPSSSKTYFGRLSAGHITPAQSETNFASAPVLDVPASRNRDCSCRHYAQGAGPRSYSKMFRR